MPEPTAAEVLPKAIVREGLPATPAARTPEAVAVTIIEKADQGVWRQGLELARRPPLEDEKIANRVEQIGIERDPNTGIKTRNIQEFARYNEAKEAANLVKKFLEKGFDGMTNAEKTELRKAVWAEAGLRPSLAAELARMTPAERIAFAERALNNPELAGFARQIFEEILDPSKVLADAVTPAQEALEITEFERDGKKGEFDEVKHRWDRNNTQLAEFEDQSATGGTKGARLIELEKLTADESTLKAELQTRQQRLRTAKDRVDDLTSELQTTTATMMTRGGILSGQRPPTEIQADITQAKKDIRNLEDEINEREAKLARKIQLEQEKQQVEQRKTELDREKREKELELKKAESEVNKRKKELADAKALRESQEKDLVAGFKGVVSEAINEQLNAEVQRLTEALNEEVGSLKEKAKESNEKVMYEALQEEFVKTETRRRGIFGKKEKARVVDKTKVNNYFDKIMTQGPEAAMRDLIMSRTNPETGNPFTGTEADAILANKEYVEKMQPEVVKQLIGRKILIGGMTNNDIDIIVRSQWGRGMIEQAMAINEEYRKAVEMVTGVGGTQSHGFWEKFRQQAKKHPWWWLLLLGAPLAFGISAVRMAPEEEELRAV